MEFKNLQTGIKKKMSEKNSQKIYIDKSQKTNISFHGCNKNRQAERGFAIKKTKTGIIAHLGKAI